MGVRRTALTLLRVNQPDGFDCPGCAWPEPDKPHTAEFCENGAKAVAEEATLRRVTPDFFAEHSVADLADRSGYWLGQQGRLTHPMYLAEGADRYEPVTWERAFDIVGEELTALDSPDEAVFYTSGRTSNEAAFLYQLFAREFGTNNLPDCSNMCHESSGSALTETIGIGKGSVLLEDLYKADLIIVMRPEPGHQPPADAHRPGEGQGKRHKDHLDQPAARGRTGTLQEPADPARSGLPAAPRSPTSSSRYASAATRHSSAPSTASCSTPREPSTRTSSVNTPTASRSSRARPAPVTTGTRRCAPPA